MIVNYMAGAELPKTVYNCPKRLSVDSYSRNGFCKRISFSSSFDQTKPLCCAYQSSKQRSLLVWIRFETKPNVSRDDANYYFVEDSEHGAGEYKLPVELESPRESSKANGLTALVTKLYPNSDLNLGKPLLLLMAYARRH